MLAHYHHPQKKSAAKWGAFQRSLQFGLSIVFAIFTAISANAAMRYLFTTWLRYPLMSFAVLGDIVGFVKAWSALRHASNRHWKVWGNFCLEFLKFGLVICAIPLPFLGKLFEYLDGPFASLASPLTFFSAYTMPLFLIVITITLLQQLVSFFYTLYQLKKLPAEKVQAYQEMRDHLFLHGKLILVLALTLASIILSSGIFGMAAPEVVLGFCIASAALLGLDVGHSIQGKLSTRILVGCLFTAASVFTTIKLSWVGTTLFAGLGLSLPMGLAIVVAVAAVIFIAKAFYDYRCAEVPLENKMIPNYLDDVKPVYNMSNKLTVSHKANNPGQTRIERLRQCLSEKDLDGAKAVLDEKLAILRQAGETVKLKFFGDHRTGIWKDKIAVLEECIKLIDESAKECRTNLYSSHPRALDAFKSEKGEIELLVAEVERYINRSEAESTPSISSSQFPK